MKYVFFLVVMMIGKNSAVKATTTDLVTHAQPQVLFEAIAADFPEVVKDINDTVSIIKLKSVGCEMGPSLELLGPPVTSFCRTRELNDLIRPGIVRETAPHVLFQLIWDSEGSLHQDYGFATGAILIGVSCTKQAQREDHFVYFCQNEKAIPEE